MAFRPEPSALLARPSPASPFPGLLLAAALLAGCGRSAAPQPTAAEAPSSLDAEDDAKGAVETLEQAEAELEQARAELAQLAIGTPAPAAPAAGAAPSPAPPGTENKAYSADEAGPASRASRAPKRAEPTEQAEAESALDRDDGCQTTCKAYSSLLRAKAAVCRLDVPNGARCARAETIAQEASAQVRGCQCAP